MKLIFSKTRPQCVVSSKMAKVMTFVWILTTNWLCESVFAAPKKQMDSADKMLWMSDGVFENDIDLHDTLQGDQPGEEQAELCPPVPATLPDGSCNSKTCTSDRDCGNSENRKCCYNGCIYTCLPELGPPAFLDWIREPRRRLRSGLSWLITGPDLANEEEPCSTSPVEEDADPLLCPQGYFCSVYQQANPRAGTPNQGLCVRVLDMADQDTAATDPPPDPETEEEVTSPVVHAHACDLDGEMLIEGHAINLDGKHCFCEDRQLICTEIDEEVKV